MRTRQFPPRQHLIEQARQQHRSVILEHCRNLPLGQRDIVENINREFAAIVEATLTQQQIQDIFGTAERTASNNRTLLGRGVDTARAVDSAINKAGQWLQNTTPVRDFDRRFERLKSQISAKFPDLAKTVEGWGTWARDNPGKTAAVIGVLTTIAALAGGPVGGAVAGQILRGTAELMKGERLSTAVGKGVKTAAYGALVGMTIDQIGSAIADGIKATASDIFPGASKLNLKFSVSGTGPGTFQDVTAYGRMDDVANIQDVFNEAASAWGQGNYQQALSGFDQARAMARELADPAYVNALTADKQAAQQILAGAKNLVAATDAVAAGAQGAVQASGQQQTTESQVRAIFRNVAAHYLMERVLSERGPRSAETQASMQAAARGDRILPTQQQAADRRYPDRSKDPNATPKPGVINTPQPTATPQPSAAPAKPGMLKRAAGAVGNKLKTVGRNLTTRVTADKLNSEWESRGRPTDDAAVVDILSTMGVKPDVISRAFGEVGLTPPASAQRKEPAMAPAATPTPTATKTGSASKAAPVGGAARPGLVPGASKAMAPGPTNPQFGQLAPQPNADVTGSELSPGGARVYAALSKQLQYLTPADRRAISSLLG